MERTHTQKPEGGRSSRRPLTALLLVQIVIGYEWLASGLSKLIRGDFPGGLADALREKSEGTSSWYRGFLESAVIPHAKAFGWAIEIAELLTGITLVAVALAWVFARGRVRRCGRAALHLATGGAALAGIVMALNFHLANGDAPPWGIPGESFDEAVDLDSLIVAISFVFLAVSVRSLLALRAPRTHARGRGRARLFCGRALLAGAVHSLERR